MADNTPDPSPAAPSGFGSQSSQAARGDKLFVFEPNEKPVFMDGFDRHDRRWILNGKQNAGSMFVGNGKLRPALVADAGRYYANAEIGSVTLENHDLAIYIRHRPVSRGNGDQFTLRMGIMNDESATEMLSLILYGNNGPLPRVGGYLHSRNHRMYRGISLAPNGISFQPDPDDTTQFAWQDSRLRVNAIDDGSNRLAYDVFLDNQWQTMHETAQFEIAKFVDNGDEMPVEPIALGTFKASILRIDAYPDEATVEIDAIAVMRTPRQ